MHVLPAAKWVTAVGGALLVTWQLAGQLNTALINHLDSTFATKADFSRLEQKVDQLIQHMPAGPAQTKP